MGNKQSPTNLGLSFGVVNCLVVFPMHCNPNNSLLILQISLIFTCTPALISGRVRLGSIRNKNNWNNANKRLFGSYSYSGIPGFPFQQFCSQEQNSRNIFRNIFLFRNIPNERSLNLHVLVRISSKITKCEMP